MDLIFPHPLAANKRLAKHFTTRDRFTRVPAEPDDAELQVLLDRLTSYTPDFQPVHVNIFQSYNRQPIIFQLAAARCQWYGWILGDSYKFVGCLTPEGRAVIVSHLVERETARDENAAELRQRYFPADREPSTPSAEIDEEEPDTLVDWRLRMRVARICVEGFAHDIFTGTLVERWKTMQNLRGALMELEAETLTGDRLGYSETD